MAYHIQGDNIIQCDFLIYIITAIRGNVLKNEQMALLLGEKDTPTSKQLMIYSISTNLTHFNIILLFTFKVSIASNKKKCTKK